MEGGSKSWREGGEGGREEGGKRRECEQMHTYSRTEEGIKFWSLHSR